MVKAAVIREPMKIDLEEFPRPKIGPKDMVVRVLNAGICGTDVEIYKGILTEFDLPLIMGHEIVGEVEEAGREIKEFRNLQIGDKIIIEGSMGCGQCEYCKSGQKRHCNQYRNYGLRTTCNIEPHLWGGFSEHIFVPIEATVHKVPDGISYDTAVLITSVIANGVQWTSLVGECKLGDVVVIQGCGPQGLACCASAYSSGAKKIIVTGTSQDEDRLQLAKLFGANDILVVDECDVLKEVNQITGGEWADLVIDVTGSPQSPQLSLDLVKAGGTYVHASQMGTAIASPLLLDTLVRKEVIIKGVRSKGAEAIRRAFDMADNSQIPYHKMVTHHFKLDEISDAFEMFAYSNQRPIKAVIQPA